ncbi:MAG: polyprenyl synthetase family protein [Deltaproteobacteria bacterium]|nr:polyprenyl synthetase family protein [Deltaproteobacteria bacterium]
MISLDVASDPFVESVEQRLGAILHRAPVSEPVAGQSIWSAARYTTLAGAAKRVRPRLVLSFGRAIGAPPDALLDLAAASELIHAASLVHDDVIDEGALRRGQPTVNVKWGNISAVLCGDLMFSVSFAQLARHASGVMSTAVSVLTEMSCAAIDEVHARGSTGLSVRDWRAIAVGKTGALMGWCASAPARLVGDELAAESFEVCGRHLGVAFQLTDDIKDLVTDDGKDRFSDIRNQNPSFPLSWTFAHAPEAARGIHAAWQSGNADVERLGRAVIEAGALEAAKAALSREVEAALEALGAHRGRSELVTVERWATGLLEAVLGGTSR